VRLRNVPAPAISAYKRRPGAGRRKPSFAWAIAKSNIMRTAGNVNSQVMSAMCCTITTVEGLDAILEVFDDAGRAATLFLNSNLGRLQKDRSFKKNSVDDSSSRTAGPTAGPKVDRSTQTPQAGGGIGTAAICKHRRRTFRKRRIVPNEGDMQFAIHPKTSHHDGAHMAVDGRNNRPLAWS